MKKTCQNLQAQRFELISKLAKLAIRDCGKFEVCWKLSQGIYYIYGMGVEGDVVEFGTMTGVTASALSAAISECSRVMAGSDARHGYDRQRLLYLFDSFEGLPAATRKEDFLSPHVASGIWGVWDMQGF
jgi:hypothetical protein